MGCAPSFGIQILIEEELALAGIEWLIEAFGCPEGALRTLETLDNLFRTIVSEMKLKPVGNSVWHRFPDTGGMTGFWLLQESHLAIHTFPEFQSACLNVFCCTERPPIDWESKMAGLLGATEIRVREYLRIYKK
ncbi:MAG: S-adenosylmethionine decarboxylase [Deltaproteobacteria bacterium]|jgi:S-adenosylmethionine decarboxylase|nr:S-adenosylmethionine decarboxylase [Deltaproteobacteria bacterium]